MCQKRHWRNCVHTGAIVLKFKLRSSAHAKTPEPRISFGHQGNAAFRLGALIRAPNLNSPIAFQMFLTRKKFKFENEKRFILSKKKKVVLYTSKVYIYFLKGTRAAQQVLERIGAHSSQWFCSLYPLKDGRKNLVSTCTGQEMVRGIKRFCSSMGIQWER